MLKFKKTAGAGRRDTIRRIIDIKVMGKCGLSFRRQKK